MIERAPSYHGYRFPPDVIAHAVWLYFRFSLSFREVEDLLAQRGITVTYETIRQGVVRLRTMADYLENHKIAHTRGAPYHPMTQGKIERYHRSMKNVVKLEKYHSPWELERAIARFVDDGVDAYGLGYRLTTPPVYLDNTLYAGVALSENHIPGGLVIAADATTGGIKWVLNTVPQGPRDDSGTRMSSSGMVLKSVRSLVYRTFPVTVGVVNGGLVRVQLSSLL